MQSHYAECVPPVNRPPARALGAASPVKQCLPRAQSLPRDTVYFDQRRVAPLTTVIHCGRVAEILALIRLVSDRAMFQTRAAGAGFCCTAERENT